MKKTRHPTPWHAPPRVALAVVALAVSVLLHAGLLGLFHAQVPQYQLLATPQLEQQLAACQARADRHARQHCRLTVVQRARQVPDLVVAQP